MIPDSTRRSGGEATFLPLATEVALTFPLPTTEAALTPHAEVALTLDGLAHGFMVPSQAIVPSPRGQGLYLIVGGKARLQPVEIGIRTADAVQILRGVNEGDRVATTNLLRLRPGLEVTAAAQ